MKPARVPQTVVAPDCWGDLPWGELYRKALERQLNPWFTKMYGFHLLKIGNLSAEINCEACAVSHQVNVSAQGMPVQVQADPLHLPFADKSVDVCLLAHTLPWCTDPHRLLREADRDRVIPYWNETILPRMKSGERVIIAAHGNSLRALVKYLDNMSEEEILELNIPTGVPLVYEFDENFKPLKRYYLGNADEIAAKAAAVANQGKAK